MLSALDFSFLNWSANDVLFTIGTALQFAPPVMFMWVFLAFTTGRVELTRDRAILGVAGAAAAATIAYLLLGYEQPRNVIALAVRPEAAEPIHDQQLLWMIVALVAAAVSLIMRRLRQGPPLRRWIGYLREVMGFRGVIFSDDIGMAAAESAGGIGARLHAHYDAGCDSVLVCSPKLVPDALAAVATRSFAADTFAPLLGRGSVPAWDALVADTRWHDTRASLALDPIA